MSGDDEMLFELPYDPVYVRLRRDSDGNTSLVLDANEREYELSKSHAEAMGMALIRAAYRLRR